MLLFQKRKRDTNETKAVNKLNRKTSETLLSSFATPAADKSLSNKNVFSPAVSDKTKSKLALFSAPEEVRGNRDYLQHIGNDQLGRHLQNPSAIIITFTLYEYSNMFAVSLVEIK
jgi:hypothetical protein